MPRQDAAASKQSPSLWRELGTATVSTVALSRATVPLFKLLSRETDVERDELALALDEIFGALYGHPLLHQTERLTGYLRSKRMIPNEQSTEELIRFVVDQVVARSPVAIPEQLVDEFWQFFNELFSSPEIRGLGSLSLDMVRLVLRTYEPLLVEVVNILKAGRRFNQWQLNEILRRAALVRNDAVIVRRQIRALRHIKPFFQTDPRDFASQAQIVAQMVREFGPFFIKMAQVAAANADFLPEQIARELAVFHEDVPPMNEDEVVQAFIECYGKPPHKLYMDFDAARPVKSGSIGSVYFAKKPFMEDGKEVLKPVVVKVGRHNIDREFAIGKLVLGLAIMSSQYWAPHSKLAPFLRAMQGQVDEFVAGFVEELDFEREATHHSRFYQRSLRSRQWRVPELYGQSRRIIEMEYLSDAAGLSRALRRLPKSVQKHFRKDLSERLLFTVLNHAVVYREIHGDLHPGNIMVGANGEMFLIDWGNVVPLEGKWPVVRDYIVGVLTADAEQLADALIRISTDPAGNAQRRDEIRVSLEDSLNKKGVKRLTRRNLFGELRRGGTQGLHRRAQTVVHLMSNTQQAGLVLHRDYLHLSRAVFAIIGSFGTLYEGERRSVVVMDLARATLRLPVNTVRDRWQDGMARKLGLARGRLPEQPAMMLAGSESPA